MGLDTIPDYTDGQTIDQEVYNNLKRVLCVDVVPRNTSGIVTDVAGALGDSTNFWGNAYARTLKLRASGKLLTLQAPSDLAETYDFTLPTQLPADSERLSIGPDGKVVFGDAGTANYKVSASCGSFSATTTPTLITNFSLTITTSGRPVWIGIIDDATGNPSKVFSSTNSTLTIVRDVTTIAALNINPGQRSHFASAINTIDVVSAGTYTYTMLVSTPSSTIEFDNQRMIVFEL